jgi:FkbM family methyltransferase
MEPTAGKPNFLRNILVKVLLFGVLIIIVRFAYIVTTTGESCNLGDFCFLPDNFNFVIAGTGTGVSTSNKAVESTSAGTSQPDLYRSKDWIKAVHFYSDVFHDLVSDGYMSAISKTLCVETPRGDDVLALKEIGILDSIGIYKKASKPLVISSKENRLPFDENTFDFIFSGGDRLDKTAQRPLDLTVSEIQRTLKPEGFFVAHVSAKDTYSFNSFLDLFNSCKLIKSRDIEGYDSSMPLIREIVLQKKVGSEIVSKDSDGNSRNSCSVPGYKRDLVRNAETLIMEEPLKPWITLKRNIMNIKYLTAMADISFKSRYVYVDVGARSYGSSIGSWFKKQYPKQNRTFDVYAIEADKAFYEEYRVKKGVTLLPYAAWVRNETLRFEINHDPGKEVKEKTRGMGRIQPVKSSLSSRSFNGEVNEIEGFDFAEWLKNTVTEKDFVVMKMDVEGTEFDLIPRLFETGAICLIDEIFLECHYNRWQRCCPGQRSSKYEKTYGQCLDLFTSLRDRGVLVHQWW